MKHTVLFLLIVIGCAVSCSKPAPPTPPAYPREGTIVDRPGLIVFAQPDRKSRELGHVMYGSSVIVEQKIDDSEIVTTNGAVAWYQIRKPGGWIYAHAPVSEDDFNQVKQMLLLCDIGTSPFKFAPMWVDGGRILPYLIASKGYPTKIATESRPHPYVPNQTVEDTDYYYADSVFRTRFVPSIAKDLLLSFESSDIRALRLVEIPEQPTRPQFESMFALIEKPRANVLNFMGCAGNRFRDVQGSLTFESEGEKLTLLRVKYSVE